MQCHLGIKVLMCKKTWPKYKKAYQGINKQKTLHGYKNGYRMQKDDLRYKMHN